jgi:putative hemolysin
VLVAVLVVINGILSGSEMALISLRESQLKRMAESGRSGRAVARLVEDPNRFLATIQIGITLAGFLASAAAAVNLAEPLIPYLAWLGSAADTIAILAITLVLSFLTLVLGELVPKRLALQRPEAWSKVVGRPLEVVATVARPAVWLLSVTTDLVVRLFGGEPGATRDEVDLREIRDMVMSNPRFSDPHRQVVVGALEVANRTLRQVLIPRPDVFTLAANQSVDESLQRLVDAGHSRAPVVEAGGLDETIGLVHIRDLVRADRSEPTRALVSDIASMPESLPVLTALRRMQSERQQMVLVFDEFGGVDGIVTLEDLVEELVGDIYDEFDPDLRSVIRHPDGTLVVAGRFPIHDLTAIGVDVPPGDYSTVAGLILDTLGVVPRAPGDMCRVGDWELTVLSLKDRVPDQVRFRRMEVPSEE